MEVSMRLSALSMLLVGTMSIGGCSNDTGFRPSLQQDQILPLATGNFWEFLRTGIDSSGTSIDSSSLMVTVGQPDTFGTEKAYPVSNFRLEFEDPGPLLRVNRTDGLYNVAVRPSPDPPSFIHVLTFPTVIGDSLPYSGYIIRTGSVNESVTVPAGSFTCIRYDILLNGITVGQTYVVPNIGIVKSWQRYFGLLRQVDQLRSYHIL